MATDAGDIEILERGNIYFFYRPAARGGTPHSLVDVQRFHLVLSPVNELRLEREAHPVEPLLAGKWA